MGCFEVEIITGPVQVYWYQIYCIKSILPPICLALHEKHLFGKSVRRIGFFGITIPEVLFLKGYGSELRIRADGSDAYELLYSGTRRILEKLHPHNRVFIEKACWILLICANSAHRRGQVNDHTGT